MGNNEAGETPESSNAKKPGFQISREPVVYGRPEEEPSNFPENAQESQYAHKYEAALGEAPREAKPGASEPPPYEDLGTLPAGYGSKSLFLVARDPEWLFCYWDIDWQEYPSARMRDGKVLLKIQNADGAEIYRAEVNPEARNWYIPVSEGNALFYAEIGFINHHGEWEVIARSNDAATPSDGISDEVEDRFATVPYHLAFQKVLDLVKMTMEEGEPLLSALSRVQGEGRRLMALLETVPSWTDDQRRVLAALLGHHLPGLLELEPGEIDRLLRRQLKERLSSESASGLLAREFPGGAAGASGSWMELGSWARAAESSLWNAWLSSWAGGSEQLSSSWLASWGGARESAFWSSYLSSWGAFAESSVLSSWLSSWSGGAESLSSASSSWPAAIGARESAFWSSWLSSWAGGAGAGLGGASGAFGSREFGASWSAQPFGRPRGFFMHVNAEVIFYGGTDPDAKVWIDGAPVELQPDGSFRFHFKFPDGDYSIPIVAQSPDGLERRSATLRFERGTSRQGDVGATAQPGCLDAPMGASAGRLSR